MRSGRRTHSIVKPGRSEDALALASEARKVFDRLGADSIRVLGGSAGADPGSLTFVLEAANATELGRVIDRYLTDSDALSVQSRLTAPESPMEVKEITAYSVLELGLPQRPSAPVGSSVVWRANVGRLEDCLQLATQVAKIEMRLGGSRSRVAAIESGLLAGCNVSTTENETFEAQGAMRDAMSTDSEWLQIAARLTGADAPGKIVRIVDYFEPHI